MNLNYLHTEIPEITADYLNESEVTVRYTHKPSSSDIMDVALHTIRIAMRLGINLPSPSDGKTFLPYDATCDNLVTASPLNSSLLGKKINFLRGWKQFDSCIKGFNGLGLMAEHVRIEFKRLRSLSLNELNAEKKRFLLSRKNSESGEKVFSETETQNFTIADLSEVQTYDLAIWNCFADRTIVCSTSSNMGISLHQALRYMQKKVITLQNKKFTLLNADEGSLIIWCPDENADFMNPEKYFMLRSLEAEKPALTKLQTYINRIQRDPGALRDALLCGGYFFPTNPQSADEVQNLLFFALTLIAKERGKKIHELFTDHNIRRTLLSLRCEITEDKVYVGFGIEGGICGLMVPYLIMLEEIIPREKVKAISTWNQASIGAALAAAVLADVIIRSPEKLAEHTRSELNSLFPNISRFIDTKNLGRDIATRIHGVFDVANLQSLAQLLGVVVEKHLSGRGTAYVGLGSSSYSNGNRCYEILNNSAETNGPFRGKMTFHPATHTLNPFAQALIFGEDFWRATGHPDFAQIDGEEQKISFLAQHVRKPEPAGAAAFAGYLLKRLDTETLSVIEIAYMLKLMGFSKYGLLEFCRFSADEQGLNKFLQEANEEGVYMGNLARNILLILDWHLPDIEEKVRAERIHSHLKCKLHPLDGHEVDILEPEVNIYLTGDNTAQPSREFFRNLLQASAANKTAMKKFADEARNGLTGSRDMIAFTSSLFTGMSVKIHWLDAKVQRMMYKTLNRLVYNKVNKLSRKNNS